MSSLFPYGCVLVTGGAGFIGSRVVPRLRHRGVRVVVADNGYVGLPLPDASDGIVPVSVVPALARLLAASVVASVSSESIQNLRRTFTWECRAREVLTLYRAAVAGNRPA